MALSSTSESFKDILTFRAHYITPIYKEVVIFPTVSTRGYAVEFIQGSYKLLLSASDHSLILRSVLLHHSLLLVLLRLDEELIGLASLSLEVLVLGEEQLEINGRFIKEHTSDGGSEFLAIALVDSLVNVVTDKVVSVVALQFVELGNIDLRKLHFLALLLLLLHHHLLVGRLLDHLLLLLANLLLHGSEVLAWLLVVTTSHLGVVVVVLSLLVVVVILVITLVTTITILEVSSLLEVATASSSSEVTTSASTTLASVTSTEVLITIILIITLGLAIVIAALHSSIGVVTTTAVLLLHEVNQLSHIVDMLVSMCVLSFILSLPEVHFQRFHLFREKTSDLIEKLDCFLSLFDTFVKDVSDLIFWRLVSELSI